MTTYPLDTSTVGTIDASGNATVVIGPQRVRERWDVTATTVTSLGMTITVSTYGLVVDSTTQDPRPTATDSTPFQLMSGNQLTVKWSKGTPGTQVVVKVLGTRTIGGGDVGI